MIAEETIAGVSPLTAFALLLIVLGLSYLTTRRRSEDPAAVARAEHLLRELLTPDELTQLSVHGYLEVPSRSQPGRTYRIPADGSRVSVHEGDLRSASLCLRPVVHLPGRESILIHKLLLEGAETEYWRRANVFPPLVPWRGWWV